MTGPPEVFISYANSDGLELSRRSARAWSKRISRSGTRSRT